jgi:flagellin-specific chaperone FliS
MEGGEIASNLKNLYGFVLESLTKADISNNRDALNDAEKVVEILQGAWHEIQDVEKV